MDYGAPVGTPVRSVADGVVEFAGTQNGYGKVIEVRHGKDRRHTLRPLEQHRRDQGPAR